LFGYIVVFAAATAHCTHSFSSIPFALCFERAQIAQSADRALRRRKEGDAEVEEEEPEQQEELQEQQQQQHQQ
jgi:hypothetical protein